jgi:protein O-mannosyl-transferase
VCAFLLLAVFVVFGQTARFRFVNFDDEEYVYENPVVQKGLSVPAVGWAFTHAQVSNWIPLTTLSHMLDCQLFGLRAGGHHVVNVLWHAANAVLLLLVLRQITGSLWRSAFVAAVFAVHPLRAESVAWVSERKDVLSGFFFMLSIGAYGWYVKELRVKGSRARVYYAAVVVFFALGLMAKSMVATLPFVLLLLDYWPLERLHSRQDFLPLLREKIPLLVVSAGSSVAAALVPGLLIDDRLPVFQRLANAVVSYVIYLRQLICPTGLAVPCLNAPNGQPIWSVGAAFVLLAAITIGVIARRKEKPFLMMGWLWYLGMLFPVIGIIQISCDSAHADRYTYLPGIGLTLAMTWAAADWGAGGKVRQSILCGLGVAVIGALIICGYRQTSFWRDDESLWTHALECSSGNTVAYRNLATVFLSRGDLDRAILQYRKGLQARPDDWETLYNLGVALNEKGDLEGAIAQYRKALQSKPDLEDARHNLGQALLRKGDLAGAISCFTDVAGTVADPAVRWANLGNDFLQKGNLDDSIICYRQAIKLDPRSATACANMGLAFLEKRAIKEAVESWEQALAIKPDQANVEINLAWLLATTPHDSLRNGARAVALAERLEQSKGGNAAVLHTLAAAYAEAGRYGEAAATARRALELAMARKNEDLTARLPNEIKIYEAGKPMRDVAK